LVKKNLNSSVKYFILNDYPNEIRKFLINNLKVFTDDGDLNKLQYIHAFVPSIIFHLLLIIITIMTIIMIIIMKIIIMKMKKKKKKLKKLKL
jgi:hypothetical protein